jgi:hypothetical protein
VEPEEEIMTREGVILLLLIGAIAGRPAGVIVKARRSSSFSSCSSSP